jgi:hypothetical protein
MIINIRGGSGAGKSTVIRKIRDQFDIITPHFVEGRKQPLWYDLRTKDADCQVRLLGHYETECGGCDTISKNPTDESETAMDFIHRLVREAHAEHLHVLYEGVILSTVNGHLLKMVEEGLPIHVVNLTSDLETCLMGISARRAVKKFGALAKMCEAEIKDERAALEPTTIKNNVGKLKSAFKTAHQLKVKGAKVYDCDRESAVTTIRNLLRI